MTTEATPAEEGKAILRQLIQHEDQLRDQRLGYLLTLNGLLFAALGIAWTAKDANPLLVVIAGMGIVIAAVSLGSMTLSDAAIRYWKNKAGEPPGEIVVAFSLSDLEKETANWRFRPENKKDMVRWLFAAWHALPLIFGIAWVLIFCLVIHKRHWW